MKPNRKYPIGAELDPEGVHFRVWAPDHPKIDLHLSHASYPMHSEGNGYFSLWVQGVKDGALYTYGIGSKRVSDPASRFQPHGVEGPSMVVDPFYPWKADRPDIPEGAQVIYEMHIGTFTKEGTFEAAAEELEELSNLGITLIEIMPIHSFPGRFGWGYDGVNLFAPFQLYGTPQEIKAFIDQAHSFGLGVILDVVYNHLGVENNHLIEFAKGYLTNTQKTDWGKAINLGLPEVKEFCLSNALYWIEEYRFDGLRLDATPFIFPQEVLKEFRPVVDGLLFAESEKQDAALIHSYHYDGVWNEDFHHSTHVRLTGKKEGYYTDYFGSAQEFISLVKYGFLYQGQYYSWQKNKRGTSAFQLFPHEFIIFLDNHDQIANTGSGKRLRFLTDASNYRAMTSYFLLCPQTILFFQGQEFNASTPFCYFFDHSKEMNELILKGHRKFLSQFPSLSLPDILNSFPNPSDSATFEKCKLDFSERNTNESFYAMFKSLLKLRKSDAVFKEMHFIKVDGAVLNTDCFLLRYFGEEEDRLLVVNFGMELILDSISEPLIAPRGKTWHLLFSSEDPQFGGEGIAPFPWPIWKIPGHVALVFK